MKIFLIYKSTGEDKDRLLSLLSLIEKELKQNNHSVFITDLRNGLDSEEKQPKIIKALNQISSSDEALCILWSEDHSEGMLIEMGYCYDRLKTRLMIKKGLTSKLTSTADTVHEWLDQDDLINQLRCIYKDAIN